MTDSKKTELDKKAEAAGLEAGGNALAGEATKGDAATVEYFPGDQKEPDPASLDPDLRVTPVEQQLGYKAGPTVGQTTPEGKPADEVTNDPEDSENYKPKKGE